MTSPSIFPTVSVNPIVTNSVEPTQPLIKPIPTQSVAAVAKPTQSVAAPTKPTPPSNATMPTNPTQPSAIPTNNTIFPDIIPCSSIQFYDWGDSIGCLQHSLSCRLQGTLRYDSADSVNQIESGLLWKLNSRRLGSQIHVYPVQYHICPYSTATVWEYYCDCCPP